jgi:hypothetical protein
MYTGFIKGEQKASSEEDKLMIFNGGSDNYARKGCDVR